MATHATHERFARGTHMTGHTPHPHRFSRGRFVNRVEGACNAAMQWQRPSSSLHASSARGTHTNADNEWGGARAPQCARWPAGARLKPLQSTSVPNARGSRARMYAPRARVHRHRHGHRHRHRHIHTHTPTTSHNHALHLLCITPRTPQGLTRATPVSGISIIQDRFNLQLQTRSCQKLRTRARAVARLVWAGGPHAWEIKHMQLRTRV
eukprot:2403342-Alexandrium_andersonii.AAC.1